MDTENICYTGAGANKDGNHTKNQYLKIMDEKYKDKCSVYRKTQKCKACKKYSILLNKEIRKQINAHKARKTYKITKKNDEVAKTLLNSCTRCKNKDTRKCDLKQYIEFSGAEPGKC